MGKTADDYALGRANDELVRFLLFKAPDLKESLYTEDEFANLESWEIAKINEIQEELADKLVDSQYSRSGVASIF